MRATDVFPYEKTIEITTGDYGQQGGREAKKALFRLTTKRSKQ